MKTARLRRPRLLIVGCGDTGMHLLERLAGHARVYALTSQETRRDALRAAGAVPLLGNLDAPGTLRRLRGLARRVVMLAPPPADGTRDTRSARLSAALRRPSRTVQGRARRVATGLSPWRTAFQRGQADIVTTPLQLVYGSTTGVYGDAQGRWIDESTPVQPATARARRRVDAEARWRQPAAARARAGLAAWRPTVLRIPGIYGRERLPLDRLKRGLPRLAAPHDVFTNHVEITDLARIVHKAVWRGMTQRVIHAADGEELRMGDYLDAVADAAGLPRPPAGSPEDVQAAVSPMMWTFMRESRRLKNERLRRELGVTLRYPRVADALKAWYSTP